jgi:hypothetical protein
MRRSGALLAASAAASLVTARASATVLHVDLNSLNPQPRIPTGQLLLQIFRMRLTQQKREISSS